MWQRSSGIILVILISCNPSSSESGFFRVKSNSNIPFNAEGKSINERYGVPDGFVRKELLPNSFAFYLRNLPLKPSGTLVKYYDGNVKDDYAYEAVVDMDIDKKNLQQCADAVMRLRGEYFYSQKMYDRISFTLTNGFKVDYTEWMKGYRIVAKGNKTWWEKKAEPSVSYINFRQYMELIFNYAGTLSLSKTLHKRDVKDIEIGDVFIVGGTPGHAVIVVDMAEDKNRSKIFMLAQSYMPAQETQILRNLNDEKLSPWYRSDITGELSTPQWTFSVNQLMTW